MYSLKLAHLLKEHTGAEIFNFYIDMRTPGKGFEEFYHKLLNEGVHFIRGRVAEVTDWALDPSEEGKLVIRVEDTLAGFVRRIPVDMVVLATGLEPQADAQEVRRMFNMSCGGEGFFLERHPKLAPVNTFTDGIFLAGCCQGAEGHSRHGRAGRRRRGRGAGADRHRLHRDGAEHRPRDGGGCSGCKTCVPLCPYHAISFIGEMQKSGINEALCKGCGTCVAACPSGSIAAESVRGRGDLRGDRRDIDQCLKILNRGSSLSSATGAPTWRPTWRGLRASSTRPIRRGPRHVLGPRGPAVCLDAFAKGADGVLIGGCHPGDCHYQEGNYKTLRRFRLLKRLLQQMGIEDERLRLEWISAAEGDGCAW